LHAPQFWLSELMLVHSPVQSCCPAAHEETQLPAVHV